MTYRTENKSDIDGYSSLENRVSKYLRCDFASLVCLFVNILQIYCRRSEWPCGLRGRSAAARLLKLRVRIPQGAWMSVCCGCCVLSGRGLCDELITYVEESYRLWCVVVCDLDPHARGGLGPLWAANHW